MCPDCILHPRTVSYGTATLEHCATCRGIYFDYGFLEKTHPVALRDRTSVSDEHPESVSLTCPGCHAFARKRMPRLQGLPILDLCPSCSALWLDPGDLRRFRQKKAEAKFAHKMKIRLVCQFCDITLDYKDLPERATNPPHCPRCRHRLCFEGVGELAFLPPVRRTLLIASLIYLTLTPFLFFIYTWNTESYELSILLVSAPLIPLALACVRAITRGLTHNPLSTIKDLPFES